jgi:tetratricopeptide (TPR) repeat protein
VPRPLLAAAFTIALGAGHAAAESDAARCDRLNDAGSFAESLPHCLAAVDAARARPAERPQLGKALNGAGFALEMTGDRGGAERLYAEALAIQRQLGASDQAALVLSNLAALAIGGGEYGRALDFLAEEEKLAREAGDAPWAAEELRIVRLNRGVAFEQLGAYREALDELRRLGTEPEPDPEHSAALEANLAVLYRNLGDPRRALRLLDSAAATYRRIGNRAALANVHLNRALVRSLNLGDAAAARLDLEQALAEARAAGDRTEEMRTLQALGELELAAARLSQARFAFDSALAIARSSAARAGETSALLGLGRAARAAGENERALELLREAEAILERASREVGDSALGESLRRDQRRLYAVAVDLLGARAVAGEAATAVEALAWSERLKARELLDALAGVVAFPPLGVPELERLARSAGPTRTYFLGERRLWHWTNHDGAWTMRDAGEARPLLAAIHRTHRALARGDSPDDGDLGRLSEALLGELPPGSELRLIPDAVLHYLPFALMPLPGDPSRRLVEARALHEIPSLSVLARLRESAIEPRWRFAAIAAPDVGVAGGGGGGEAERDRGRAGALLASRFALPPLPASAREAADAASRIGGETAVDTGHAASEARLFERAAEGARVLHVAAHTLVDEGLEEGVAIVLAADSSRSAGGGSDGFVTPAEIARAKFATDLVVLSGCRTALPADESGSGRSLASLSGALFAAGARSVVASLWPVGDEATAALMSQFYFELAAGADAAEALRRAQRRMASDSRWSAPHRWAGFVVAGEPTAVVAARSAHAPFLAAAACVLAGAALWRFGGRRAGPKATGPIP